MGRTALQWLAAGADRVARWLERQDIELFVLDPEALRRVAMAREGTDWLGPTPYAEGLSMACASATQCDLNIAGRYSLWAQSIQGLRNGIRLERAFRQRPELADQALNSPLIVTGLPRSGTTHLHRLLALHPDARELPTWEVRAPLPGPMDLRRVDARLRLWALSRLAPELDRKHLMRADLGEEELTLFDHTGWTPTFWRLAQTESYLEWYLQQDPLPAYQEYRRWLQVLQAQTPHKRLVLKLPNHTGFLDALAQAVPEAHLIQCHRPPTEIIPSYASLAATVHQVHQRSQDLTGLGRSSVRLWSFHANRGLAARERIDENRLTDAPYARIREAPVDLVRTIHRRAGLQIDPSFDQALHRALEQRPQHAHGKHLYALGDTGLDGPSVDAAFAPYLDWARSSAAVAPGSGGGGERELG